jgi:hypothetical protein
VFEIAIHFLRWCVSFLKQLFEGEGSTTSSGTSKKQKRLIRNSVLKVVEREKIVRLLNGKIPQPFGYVLNVLCNMVTISGYVKFKFPQMISKKADKYDEYCRDMKVLIREYDYLVTRNVEQDIADGKIIGQNIASIRNGINDAFTNTLEDNWYEWLERSQKKVSQYLSLLNRLSTRIERPKAEMLQFIVHQALTLPPIGGIVETDENDLNFGEN